MSHAGKGSLQLSVEAETGTRATETHSHFPDLLAVISQDLEEPVENLWQVIQKVNIRNRLQNQDLTQQKEKQKTK